MMGSLVDGTKVLGRLNRTDPARPRHTRKAVPVPSLVDTWESLETWPCMNAQHRIFRRRPPSAEFGLVW